jgi:hypothetical protein
MGHGEMSMVVAHTRKIEGKEYVFYKEFPTKRGAQQAAAKIRGEVPYRGYNVRVVKTSDINWGVYIHDGIKKPWERGYSGSK